jgi:hypothetical protein
VTGWGPVSWCSGCCPGPLAVRGWRTQKLGQLPPLTLMAMAAPVAIPAAAEAAPVAAPTTLPTMPGPEVVDWSREVTSGACKGQQEKCQKEHAVEEAGTSG